MSVWIVVTVVGAGTIALKGVGPALLGTRPLPPRLDALVALLAPSLLAALVVTQTLGGDGGLVVDSRVVGVSAAAVAIALRAPLIVVVAIAALVTALVRALV